MGHFCTPANTTPDQHSPTAVPGLTGVVAIAAGGYHTLELENNGAVVAWGSNSNGQLGDGNTTNQYSPTVVPGLNLGSNDFVIATGVTGSGVITCSPSTMVAMNSSSTCTATPYAGSYVASVTVDGASQPASANTASYAQPFNDVTANHTMSAVFSTDNSQTIIFNPATLIYSAPPFNLSNLVSGGGSGNPVTFTLVSGPGSLSGANNATLTITGAGSVVLSASQAGSAIYNAASNVVQTITVNKATITVTLGNLSAIYNGTPNAATATTTPIGKAVIFTYNGSSTVPTVAGSYTVVATISDANYQGTATGTLTIAKATPTITWTSPADITYGTALGTAQLNATASVPGTFTYTPAVGTIMSGGSGQTLTAIFAPTDATDYNSTINNVGINVAKATASITLGNLIVAYDGTPKAVTATTIPVGKTVTITYNGSGTMPTAAGSYAVVATINETNYQGTASGTLIITAPPILSLSTLADGSITDNSILNISGTVSDAGGIKNLTINGVNVPFNADGSFSYVLTLTTGANLINTIATDNAGNQATDTRTITLDQTAPVLVITTPADNSATANPLVTVSGTVNKTATVTVGSNSQTATMNGMGYSADITLVPGANTIVVTATDLAGNTSSQKRTIIYDNQAPTLAITIPSQDISTNLPSLTIIGAVSDPYTDVTVSIAINGQTYTPAVVNGQFQQVVNFTTQKSYAIVVTATNGVGVATTVQRNVIYKITAQAVSLTFSPNGAYTVVGPADGLTITIPDGHETGITPSYNVILPAQATNVVVTCYGGGGSPDSEDSGYVGSNGDMVQSSTVTGILGTQLDLFVGQGSSGVNSTIAWPDAQYTGLYWGRGLVGASSSIYYHGGQEIVMLAGGGDDGYSDYHGPVTRGPYNTNNLGDFGGTVTIGAGGAGGDTTGNFVPAGNGWITITYLLQPGQ